MSSILPDADDSEPTTTRTAEDGTYELSTPPIQPDALGYLTTVSVAPRGERGPLWRRYDREASTRFDFELPPLGVLEGVVRVPGMTTFPPGISLVVTWTALPGEVRPELYLAPLDAGGAYRVEGVPTDRDVLVHLDVLTARALGVGAQGTDGSARVGQDNVLALAAPQPLWGRLRGPLPVGALCILHAHSPHDPEAFHVAFPGVDGSFAFADAPPGEYDFTLALMRDTVVTKHDLGSRDTRAGPLDLDVPATRLTRIDGMGTGLVERATVTATGTRDVVADIQLARFPLELDLLDGQRYDITASSREAGAAARLGFLAGATLNLTPRPALRIQASVQGRKPARGSKLVARRAGERWPITGLGKPAWVFVPEGTYDIVLEEPGQPDRVVAPGVPAGATGIVIRVE